jgi:hypothetical protein
MVCTIRESAGRGGRNINDEEYRKCRTRPLLLVHLLKPYVRDEEFDTGGLPLVATGLSFPEFDDRDVTRRVRYRVNLVEWRNLFGEEVDDDQDDEPVI